MSGSKRYICFFCGHIYDEQLGEPKHGIPAGTPFADLPEDWTCPDCGARKEDFYDEDSL